MGQRMLCRHGREMKNRTHAQGRVTRGRNSQSWERAAEPSEHHRIALPPRYRVLYLVILRRVTLRRVLQAIERALASQRLAVSPQHGFYLLASTANVGSFRSSS
jgi:hypothetical protein